MPEKARSPSMNRCEVSSPGVLGVVYLSTPTYHFTGEWSAQFYSGVQDSSQGVKLTACREFLWCGNVHGGQG